MLSVVFAISCYCYKRGNFISCFPHNSGLPEPIDLFYNVDIRTVLSMAYMYLWLTTALRVIGVLCLRIFTLYSTAQFSHRCLDREQVNRQYHQVPDGYLAIDSAHASMPFSAIFLWPIFSVLWKPPTSNYIQDGVFEIVILSIRI